MEIKTMSPAYDGLSDEQRKVKAGTHFYHTCHNAIPNEAVTCPFCGRWNTNVSVEQLGAAQQKNEELAKENAKLEKQLKKLKKKTGNDEEEED
jgi:predicted ATP-dependent serine protease